MNIKKITIVHVGDFLRYPPVISLIENLLKKDIKIDVISSADESKIPQKINQNNKVNYINVTFSMKSGIVSKIKRIFSEKKKLRAAVDKSMIDSDILWTTTDATVKNLGKQVLKYKHVMQLMELIERYPLFMNSKHFDFPIDEYARKAYKVVVPNLDRAYIQQAWWNLPTVPSVLPNKPYSIEIANKNLPLNTREALNKIKEEKRKIILYSGLITPERNIGDFAEAIKDREDYCIYVMGKNFGNEAYLKEFLHKYPNVEYIGYHIAPLHLLFFKYAYIGLTPYVPTASILHPKLNALYCAPNKIYEYSAFGVPMLGTDVIGLLRPFEQYKIGKCIKNMDSKSILDGIEYIDSNHEEMSQNAKEFFEKDNLDKIVLDILK